MAFVKKQGKTKQMFLPVTTSTVLTKGFLCTFSSGLLINAVAGTAAADLVGVLVKSIAATDADYATARLIAVEVPVERYTVWEGASASLVAGDIGIEVDLSDGGTVNRGRLPLSRFELSA
jgi:hypothetical protein